mgnify:CR=1 FL=1
MGDSLGLPRKGVAYEDTWFYKLSLKFPQIHFISKFVRELTTDRFNPIGDFSEYYMPDVVITQFGVVDCAPRVINDRLSKWKFILSLSSSLRIEKYTWKIIKKLHHRDNPNTVYVSPNDFERNIIEYFSILHRMGVQLIVVIKIGMPGLSVRKKSPCFAGNVKKYNAIYEKVAKQFGNVVMIDPLKDGDDMNYVDGYHTNERGFQLIHDQLEQILANNEVVREAKGK